MKHQKRYYRVLFSTTEGSRSAEVWAYDKDHAEREAERVVQYRLSPAAVITDAKTLEV